MKRVSVYLLAMVLFVVGQVLFAQEAVPSEDPAGVQSAEINLGPRPGTDQPGKVKAPLVSCSAAEQRMLQDLKQARAAGDQATARDLQASLDRMYGNITYSKDSAVQQAPKVHGGKAEGEGPGSYQWGGDVLVTNPSVGSVKPSITNSPSGVLYAAVEVQLGNNIRVYRSTDNGVTWSYIYWFGTGDDCRNPNVAHGGEGDDETLYIAFEVLVGNDHGVAVTSLNLDALVGSYTYVVWGFLMPGSEQVYPAICTDSLLYADYNIYVTYSNWSLNYYPVWFSRSNDQGVSFSTPWNITGGAENSSWPSRPDIAIGSPGLFITYEKLGWTGFVWANQPWVRESENFGSTFYLPLQLAESFNPGYHPTVAVAQEDFHVVIAYTKEYTDDSDVNYAYTDDGGFNWYTENNLPWTYDDEKSPDLCASDGVGGFHAAYYQDTNNVMFVSTLGSAPYSWNSGTVVNDVANASSTFPRPSVCVNPTLPLEEEGCVAWTDFRNFFYGVYFDSAPLPGLAVDSEEISAATGGSIQFSLNAGSANAYRTYLILGSLHGTSPGVPLPGGLVTLPINWDNFTGLVLENLNLTMFSNFLSVLDHNGRSTAQLNMGPFDAKYIGKVMNYAYLLEGTPDWDFVSNSVSVQAIP